MNESASAVIKSDEVKMGGKVRLGPATAHHPQPGAVQQNQQQAGVARIAKTAEDHVIIEVTCRCGTKTMVRCNF
jgi:hypothetical protein